MSDVMWITVIVALFALARVFIRRPDLIVRTQLGSATKKDYPEGSEAQARIRLARANPSEWLNQNPRIKETYRLMGYVIFAAACVGLLTLIGQLLYEAIMPS